LGGPSEEGGKEIVWARGVVNSNCRGKRSKETKNMKGGKGGKKDRITTFRTPRKEHTIINAISITWERENIVIKETK